jgi:hypothetical protein
MASHRAVRHTLETDAVVFHANAKPSLARSQDAASSLAAVARIRAARAADAADARETRTLAATTARNIGDSIENAAAVSQRPSCTADLGCTAAKATALVRIGVSTLIGFIPGIGDLYQAGTVAAGYDPIGDVTFSRQDQVDFAGISITTFGLGVSGAYGHRISEVVDDVPRLGSTVGETIARVQAEEGSVVVLGRWFDTPVLENQPGHIVLNASDWTPQGNDAFMNAVIAHRRPVYLASNPSVANLVNAENQKPTQFGIEFRQLRDAGYVQMGNYMVPPSG